MITRKAELLISRKVVGVQNFTSAIEFLIALSAFLISRSLLLDSAGFLFIETLLFSSVVSVSLVFARLLLAHYGEYHSGVCNMMIRNLLGTCLGVAVMLMVRLIMDFGLVGVGEFVFAGVISFFMLGTLMPVITPGKTLSA